MNHYSVITEGAGGWRGGILYEDPVSRSLLVSVGRPAIGGFVILTGITVEDGMTLKLAPDNPGIEPDVPPLRIQTDLARTLYELLHRWYGGPLPATGETKETRADLLHERARVDKLLDFLTSSPEAGS